MNVEIKFVFNDIDDARPFVKHLMDCAVSDVIMKSNYNDFTATVTYGIDTMEYDAQLSIEEDISWCKEKRKTPTRISLIEDGKETDIVNNLK